MYEDLSKSGATHTAHSLAASMLAVTVATTAALCESSSKFMPNVNPGFASVSLTSRRDVSPTFGRRKRSSWDFWTSSYIRRQVEAQGTGDTLQRGWLSSQRFLSGLAHPGVPSSDSLGAWPPRAWGPTSGKCVVVALAARGAYGLDRRAACRSTPWHSMDIWPLVSPWSGLTIREPEPRRPRTGSPKRTAQV